MTPRQWDRIQELINLALEQPESERAALLERVCGEDHRIRREVESLLSANERAGDFIEESLRQATISQMELGKLSEADMSRLFVSASNFVWSKY